MTSSLQDKRVTFGHRSVGEATKDLSGVQTGVKGQVASAWQTLKSKSEGQIRDNDKRIIKIKAQKAGASRTFRAAYDQRVTELERRNLALKKKLNDFKGDRGETWADYK